MTGALGRMVEWLCDAIVIAAWVILVVVVALLIWLALTIHAGAACLSHAEAKAKWPDSHLYWHGDGHCWDDSRRGRPETGREGRGREEADSRGDSHAKPPDAPVTPVSARADLERATPSLPKAEIFFPALQRNMAGLETYEPPLSWRQPWLAPDTIAHWPLLIDVDRTPFVTWNRRIGQ